MGRCSVASPDTPNPSTRHPSPRPKPWRPWGHRIRVRSRPECPRQRRSRLSDQAAAGVPREPPCPSVSGRDCPRLIQNSLAECFMLLPPRATDSLPPVSPTTISRADPDAPPRPLSGQAAAGVTCKPPRPSVSGRDCQRLGQHSLAECFMLLRSEERRVGKECRSRWSPYH